jgi:hypothetical protein
MAQGSPFAVDRKAVWTDTPCQGCGIRIAAGTGAFWIARAPDEILESVARFYFDKPSCIENWARQWAGDEAKAAASCPPTAQNERRIHERRQNLYEQLATSARNVPRE